MKIRLFTTAALLLGATVLSAQQYKSLTSVATFKVPAGKEDAFVAKGKAFTAVLDKMMASGSVLAYGMDVDLLHVPTNNNVAFWYTSPNFDALEKAGKAIDDFAAANPGLMQELTAMSDPAAHHDFIVRAAEENHKNAPAGAHPVGDFDETRVKAGRMSDFMELFRKYDKPVLDKLVADGVIYGYEVDTEAVHTMESGLVWQIVSMPGLGAKDKVNAAFEAAQSKLPESERNMVDKLYTDILVPGSHRDSLSVSEVFKEK